MLRCEDSIRLSAVDQALFEAVTGAGRAAPTRLSDYNRRLRQAECSWSLSRRPGERALAKVARSLMLDADDPSAVLDEHILARLGGLA